jgi:putative SOS response-associated peptidase YedK
MGVFFKISDMCFRSALSVKYQQLAKKYGKMLSVIEMYKEVYGDGSTSLTNHSLTNPKYLVNAFSNPLCPIVTADPQIQLYSWGLIPNWLRASGNEKELQAWRTKTINARCETVFEKPSFRTPIIKGRCLFPSTGYFEYHHEKDGTKTPYFIHLKNTDLFSMAGIYDRWQSPDGQEIYSFSLITTPANELTGWIHNGGTQSGRMPIIFSEDDEKRWLQPDLTFSEITALMKTYPAENMQAYAVKKDFIKKNPNDATILEPETNNSLLF